jgi:polyisoprenoid-binding protein YceI
MTYFLTAIIALVTSVIPLREQGTLYNIDLSQSTIDITIFQEGFLSRVRPSHAIQVKTFSGWVRYTPGKESQSSAELTAEAKSLFNAEKGISETERREFENALRNIVLEAPKYPEVVFRSVAISDLKSTSEGHTFTLNGDLTMHGVKRRIAIPVAVSVSGSQLTASGGIIVKQTDYQMKPYEGAFGLIKIKDDVKVAFSIVAKSNQ